MRNVEANACCCSLRAYEKLSAAYREETAARGYFFQSPAVRREDAAFAEHRTLPAMMRVKLERCVVGLLRYRTRPPYRRR